MLEPIMVSLLDIFHEKDSYYIAAYFFGYHVTNKLDYSTKVSYNYNTILPARSWHF